MKTGYIVTGIISLAVIGSVGYYTCQNPPKPAIIEKTQIIHDTISIKIEDTAQTDSIVERYEKILIIKNQQIAKLKKEKNEIKIDSLANYDILYWLQGRDSTKHSR